MSSSSSRGLTAPRLAVIFCLILAIFIFRDSWLPEVKEHANSVVYTSSPLSLTDDTRPTGIVQRKKPSEDCRNAPGADNVMVVIKTGATELYEKLPTHFVTLLKCTPHVLIYSDLAQTFADTPILDAIAPVSTQFKEHHPDFELYRKLQAYQQSGQDMSLLKGDGGWNLDKWKFLPMMHEAFAKAPEQINWFVYMEADTSVSWTNLLQWLNSLNPKKTYYMGSQNAIAGSFFAHGGSGYVVSRAAAEQLASRRETEGPAAYDDRWEDITSSACCGDEIVARALREVGVGLTGAWPLIQGETVSTIDWTKKHWCAVAVTHHHVTPLEIDALWQFQMDWVDAHGWAKPYLHSDLFEHFISRHVSVTRQNWNNISKDKKIVLPSLAGPKDVDFTTLEPFEQKAVESQEACEAVCRQLPAEQCIQWMFAPGRCYLGKVVRFGKSDERESEHWVSGWLGERVEEYRESFEGCRTIKWIS